MPGILAVAVALTLLFLVFYVVVSAVLIFHLFRFAVRPAGARALSAAYLVISVALFVVGLSVVLAVSWNAPASPSAVPARTL